MAVTPGTHFGPYEIVAPLGAGGMGEVWRARDTKLGREVALKFLPPQFAEDPERLARFEREAKTLAALNHPHIAHIHGLEESADHRALVMELVEGETLAERIARGAVPVDEALPLATQLADALEYAHEHGVVHRDLKPANIKITPDGAVKVLDFGLAKALEGGPPGSDPANSPTITSPAMTRAGVILGTAAYMSPEQARGATVDKRADIWAFGVVLYEMLIGRACFGGQTVTDVLAAVVRAEPDWSALPADTPWRVRDLLRHCLTKDPKQRLHDMGDARLEIEEAISGVGTDAVTAGFVGSGTAQAPRRWRLWWALPWVLVGALALSLGWSLRHRSAPVDQVPTRFTIPVPTGFRMWQGEGSRLTISPDGRVVAYVTAGRLHVRSLAEFEARVIPGTDGAEGPFFSPDSQWVGFSLRGGLKKVAVGGGPIVDIPGSEGALYSADWSASGSIAFPMQAGQSGLWLLPAEGGQPVRLTTISDTRKELAHSFPQLLDRGKLVLFTSTGPSGLWSDARIELLDRGNGDESTLLTGAAFARYVPTGHLLYFDARGTLFAVPFDLERRQLMGPRVPLLQNICTAIWAAGAASFAVSNDGTIAYAQGTNHANHLLQWVDRRGTPIGRLGEPLTLERLQVSPDGRRVATWISQPDNADVWIIDLATAVRDRVTFDPAWNWYPVWSPDGRHMAYTRSAGAQILIRDLESGTERVVLSAGRGEVWPYSWSADGKWLLFGEHSDREQRNLFALRTDAVDQRVPVATTPADEHQAEFSPDGRYIAYAAGPEVYVVAFPDPRPPQQVSTGGGRQPRWSKTGDELFYLSGDAIMVAATSTAGLFTRSAPQLLFRLSGISDSDGIEYAVAPGSQRFLVKVPNPDAPAKEIHIVLDWLEELKAKVPVQ